LPKYTIMFGSARTPTSRPPRRPAMPWVYTTPRASSTLLNGHTYFGSVYQAAHTIAGVTTPMMMAPRPLT
jgi:hypothetical protein